MTQSTANTDVLASKRADRAWLPVLALTLLALALRVVFLDRQSLWVDEALSVVFANRPLPDLMHTLVTADIHPPFYPLLLHFWFGIAGTGEAAVRLPSVVFGTLLVPAVYALASSLAAPDRRIGRWWGLTAAALVAISPYLVYFAQEARNYSAVTLWVTLALAALWRAMSTRRRIWWVAYGLATLLALYTHYNAFLMLVPPPLLMLVAWRRLGWALRPWIATVVLVGLGYLPWVAFALSQLARIDDFWPGTIALTTVIERTLLAFAGGRGVLAIPVGILAAALVVLGLRPLRHRGLRGEPLALVFLLLNLSVPLIALYAIIALRPKFNARYLIVIAPLFYVLLARGIVALATPQTARRWLARTQHAAAVIAAAGLALTSLAGVQAVYVDPAYAKEDYRDLAHYVEQRWQPGDVIVLVMDAYQPIAYYGKGQLAYQGLQPYEDQQWAVERLNEIASRHQRIWLVLWQADWADPTRYARHVIEEAARELPVTASFHGLGLRLFELPPGARFNIAPRIAQPVEQRFGEDLLLLGWNEPRAPRAGEQPQYDLHWRALRPPASDATTTLTVRQPDGQLVAKADCPTGYWTYPPPRWEVGAVVHSQCAVRLPGYLDGAYEVTANLWDREHAAPIPRVAGSGDTLAPEQPLGTLRVAPLDDRQPAALRAQRLARTFAVDDQPVLLLHGAEVVTPDGAGERTARLTLFWEAPSARPPADYTLEVRAGDRVLLRDVNPAGSEATSHWPPRAWRIGELGLEVPADLAPGEHPLSLALVERGTGRRIESTGPAGEQPAATVTLPPLVVGAR